MPGEDEVTSQSHMARQWGSQTQALQSFHLKFSTLYSVDSEHPVHQDRHNEVICVAYQELLLTTQGSKEKFKQNYQNLNLSSCQPHLPTSAPGIENENFIWCISHLVNISLW